MAVNTGRHGHPFFKSLCEFALRLIAHIQRNGCDRLINSPLDETLIPFQSCIQGYGYEVNEYSKKDYADGLRETVQTLMKSIPGYYCFIAEFKVNEDQTTAHTALGHSERFYKKTEEGIALSEWIAAAFDGRQIQNVGLSLLK